MTPGTWSRISDLFAEALERPSGMREAFVAELRQRDAMAAAEVTSLLEAHARPGEFLPELPDGDEPADLTGRVVGPYRLVRLIGAGGTGVVYLAERNDGAFARRVAVKLLSASFQQSRERFLHERRILAGLDHPNIARLLDAGTTADHVLYLVMEHVEGVPIDRYSHERQATVDERLALLLQVCAGVAHAHRNLVVHCDIKPENILVGPDGAVKLLDFGIARLMDPDRAVTRWRPATPAYSSPEQLRGEAITTASDVYSLGVLAYVLLTGSGPYSVLSNRPDEMMHAVLTAEPRRAAHMPGLSPTARRAVTGDLENVLAMAVAKEPARRYSSVEQFADDLQAVRSGRVVRARPATLGYRLRRAVGRHRLAFALGAVLGTSLVGTTVSSVWQARLAERRFADLRAFARAVVFDVNDALAPIAGTVGARSLLVQTALRYLDRLAEGRPADPLLREELAAAYLRIGKVQGGAFLPNLGDSSGAIASFRKAMAVAGEGGAPAIERLRIEALISEAQLAVDPIRGTPGFDAAARAAERLLAADETDLQSLRLLADAIHGRATIAHLTGNVPLHTATARRQIAVRERVQAAGGTTWQDAASLARARAQLALALEQEADYEGALTELDRAQATLAAAIGLSGPNQMVERGLAEVRSRRAPVLLALGRVDEAAREALTAADLLQPLVASDPLNVQYRADLAYAWLRLGDARRAQGRLDEALALHRQALTVRRERAEHHAGFIFVPWELTRSLNAVANLLLEHSPAGTDEALRLFTEARDVGIRTLERAPSYTQIRRQVALAEDGVARATRARAGRIPGPTPPR